MNYIKINETITIEDKTLVCKEGRDCHRCDMNFKLCKEYACMPLERKDGEWAIFKVKKEGKQ